MKKSKYTISAIMIIFPLFLVLKNVITDRFNSLNELIMNANTLVMFIIIAFGIVSLFSKHGVKIQYYAMLTAFVCCIALENIAMIAYAFLMLSIIWGILNKINISNTKNVLALSVVYYSITVFQKEYEVFYLSNVLLYFVFSLLTYVILEDFCDRYYHRQK